MPMAREKNAARAVGFCPITDPSQNGWRFQRVVATKDFTATIRATSMLGVMAIYPGDPRAIYRRRRGLINGVQGVLFLPAQGGWLLIAMSRGGAWWAVWGVVLAILIGAVIVVGIQEHSRGLRVRPPAVTVLFVLELVAIAGWCVASLLR